MKYFFYSIFFVIPVLLFAGVGSHVNSLHTHYYKDGQVPYSPRNVHTSSAGSFHLITHGRPGQLLIEGRWRNAAAIVQFIQQKQLFTPAVKQLNIYGCEFAKGAIGLAAVQYLEKHLQVRVAASTNITGAGGDYVLEIGSVNIAPLLAGFKGSLQCAGTPGGTAPGDDFDKDGICNSDDIDDDNDGVLDEMEMNCGQDYLNASDYQKGATVSTTTDLGGGGLVVTDFSTTRNFVLTDYPNGTAGGVISYLLDYDQGNPNFFYYITQLKFNKPVKVRIVFPGAGPAGEHNRTDIFTLTTPGSTTGFTVYNPDSAITITNNVAGEFSFNPNSADPDGEIAPSQQGYFVETTEWVTRLDIKVGSTRSGSVNDVSTRVIIMACNTLDIDTDGDGIFNRFDLDSDGDGCSDAEETGIVGTLQPAVLNNSSGLYYSTQALAQGAYGANGFADAIETSPGSGTYKGDYIAYSNATNNAIASCTPMPILTRPDMNVTLPGSAATGNLNTNDTVPDGSSYGSAVPVPGYSNPGTATPVVNTDGSYSFTGATPGVYKFYVPVCPPSVTENCPSELLTIQVVDPSQAGNPPVTGADIAVMQSGGAVTIPTLANDQAGGRGFAIDTSSLTISTPPKTAPPR